MEEEKSIWLEGRKKGKISAITYIRNFLSLDLVFVPMYQVLVFFAANDWYWINPFMEGVIKGLQYNGTKVIVYDNSTLGKCKGEYLEILRDCGYENIETVVCPEEFGISKCNTKFFKAMTQKYHIPGKRYGVMDQHINLFAKINHLDFLPYSSPDIYPKRYIFNKKNGAHRVFETFVNTQLYSGYRMETLGYHFGYAFAGIFYYMWAQYINKRAKGRAVAFAWEARHLLEVYQILFPEADSRLVFEEENEAYYIDGDAEKLCSHEVWKKYSKYILKMQKEVTSQKIIIKEVIDGEPVWDINSMEEDDEKRNEVLQGVWGFAREFHDFLQGHGKVVDYLLEDQGEFLGSVCAYAFDEKRKSKVHYDKKQLWTESPYAKKCFKLMQKTYRKVKGK